MNEKRITLSEIMNRPLPPINEEKEKEIRELEELFSVDKKCDLPKYALGEDPNDSPLSQEIYRWVQND